MDSEKGPKQGLRICRNAFGTILKHHQNHWKIIEKSLQNHGEMMPESCWDDARSIPKLSQVHQKIM